MKTTIQCNMCGGDFTVKPLERKDGDLDITYIKCPHCNEEFLVSVTDSVLRDAIKRHNELIRKSREATDIDVSSKVADAAWQMKEKNEKRCSELMDEYRRRKEDGIEPGSLAE